MLAVALFALHAATATVSAQSKTSGQKKSQTSQQTKKSTQQKKASTQKKQQQSKQTQSKGSSTAASSDQKTRTGDTAATGQPKSGKTEQKTEPVVNFGALPVARLFNGKDLAGWKLRDPNGKQSWSVVDGVLTNTDKGTDLVSEEKFTDFELHVEVRVPKGGNSGVYLQGRYEIQIGDTAGMTDLTNSMMGAIYSKIAPKMNAAKPAGEWQSLDVHFMQAVRDKTGAVVLKPMVTVILNDEIIIDRGEIDGPTGGALDADEGTPGPIMLQGDHTAVEYRNIIIRKLPPRELPAEDEEEEPPIPPKKSDTGTNTEP